MSRVSLTKIGNDIHSAVTRAMVELGQQVIAPGDHVLIKPNLVQSEAPDSGEITHFTLVEAVARYCLDCNAAEVVIGEGPGYYQPRPRLRDCFTLTGISEVAQRLGIEWVVFDEHSYRTFRNVSDCTPDEFRVTEFVFNYNKIINLPALKTHYLTTVTLAMKNLKGCLKWEDKPLFHQPDLGRAIVELNKIIRPAVNIIDATKWKSGGLLIASSDIVAVDTVGCALMGIDPMQVRTIELGKAAGLGEAELINIDIIGEELKQLKFKVKLPQEQLRQSFPLLEIVGAQKACSGCIIPLVSALFSLRERGVMLEKSLIIYLGKDPQVQGDEPYLLVGDCADVTGAAQGNIIGGCPLDRQRILDALVDAIVR